MKLNFIVDGKPYALPERSASMLRFILKEQAAIESIAFGRLTLNFAGRRVRGELTQSFRSPKDDESA